MAIHLMDLLGSPNIGVYGLATEAYAIVPVGIPSKKVERISECLGVEAFITDVGETKLVGVLLAANSSGMLAPYFVEEEELEVFKRTGAEVVCMEEKFTAWGNLVLANDKGAVCSPELSKRTRLRVEEVLGVEVVPCTINGLPYVGSLAVATNKGVLAHPEITEEEKRLIEEVLRVRVEVGTVNGGVSLVSSGILANSKGAVVGSLTTGPELVMISTALEVS